MVRNIRMNITCPAAASANETVAAPVAAMSMPPTAGPVMAASWNVEDSQALALANSAGSSSCGRIVFTDGDANARAVPIRKSSE